MMLSNWKLAKEGWNNLKTITEDGWNGLKDVLMPSKEDVVRQVTDVNPTPKVNVMKYGKYVKYVLIGGAALVVLSILKK